jgi:hypothetical protein
VAGGQQLVHLGFEPGQGDGLGADAVQEADGFGPGLLTHRDAGLQVFHLEGRRMASVEPLEDLGRSSGVAFLNE